MPSRAFAGFGSQLRATESEVPAPMTEIPHRWPNPLPFEDPKRA